MTDAAAMNGPARPPKIGTWVAVTVVSWHLAFFATGAVTLALASSPAGSVFEGLAEPFHQKLLLASHLRVLAGYGLVALGALALTYPAVRLWIGTSPVTRWGVVARTLAVLAVLMLHGWLRLAHTQPYFLGAATYDSWYFRMIAGWSEEVRARVLFIAFQFLPAVALVAAAGVYIVETARWFREGGRRARLVLAAVGTTLVVAAGWHLAPHFTQKSRTRTDGRYNVLMLSSSEVRHSPANPASPTLQPHLADLASQSVVLTSVHSPLPSAVSEAATLMTGQAPHSHGLQTPLPPRETVACALNRAPELAALLDAQGYATAVIGDESAGAFAVAEGLGFTSVNAGPTGAYPRHLAATIYPAHFIIPAWLDNQLGHRLLPDLGHLAGLVSPTEVTHRLTQRLEEGAESETPFFIHGVYGNNPAPNLATPPTAASPAAANTTSDSINDGPETFDHQLARVLECLEETGLKESTILIVLGRSDPQSRDPQPTTPPTHDSRTPGAPADTSGVPPPVSVVFHVPGEPFPPAVVPQLARLQDIAPTLLDILGLPAVKTMDGVSLRPCLENPATTLPLVAFGESPGFDDTPPTPSDSEEKKATFRASVRLDPDSGYRIVLRDESAALRRKTRWVRTRHWELVFTPAESSTEGIDHWRLFDLRADPHATRDVKLLNPKVWQTLELALRQWADEKHESRLSDLFPAGEPPATPFPGT